jgi:ketosteroid isomerase-like protein
MKRTVGTEETRQVVADYVAALQRGDIDALRGSFTPQATWTIRGDIPVAGTWTGPDGILDGFLAQVSATPDPAAPVSQDLHRIIADGDHAVAMWTSHARAKNGAQYDRDQRCALAPCRRHQLGAQTSLRGNFFLSGDNSWAYSGGSERNEEWPDRRAPPGRCQRVAGEAGRAPGL